MATTADDGRAPILEGAVAGVLAYVVGYLLTYLLTSGAVRGSGLNRITEAVTGQETVWKIVGWLFYNAHFVETVLDVPVVGSDAVNYVARGDAFSPVLYLVPPLLLLGAGVAVARRRPPAPELTAAAVTGATVVAGYLPLAAAGAFLFEVAEGGASAGPDPVVAVAVAGAFYPLAFGALGGIVALRR